MGMLLTWRPRPPLDSTVDCIWHHEGRIPDIPGRERVLPNGRFQMVVNLAAGAAAVSGLRSAHVVVKPAHTTCVMGVVWRPGAAGLFFPGSALEFSDRSVPLEVVWGVRASRLVDRLREEGTARRRLGILQAMLVDVWGERDAPHGALHPAVTYALLAFHQAPRVSTVTDVSRESGWSRRWLTRAFAESVGMTPKRYCRLLRFQHVVREVAAGRRVEWADLAASSGFSDQAHLVHEFRSFSGLTPEQFLRAERPFANHVRVD